MSMHALDRNLFDKLWRDVFKDAEPPKTAAPLGVSYYNVTYDEATGSYGPETGSYLPERNAEGREVFRFAPDEPCAPRGLEPCGPPAAGKWQHFLGVDLGAGDGTFHKRPLGLLDMIKWGADGVEVDGGGREVFHFAPEPFKTMDDLIDEYDGDVDWDAP